MSCSPFDLRDYFLRELADPQQRQVEAHLKTCRQCRQELDRLRITEAALFSLRDEEIPQRIAFVSDRVFEPSPWRRWWDAFWGSSARLGFASAAMLSGALVFFAATRPATIVQRTIQAPAPQVAARTVSDEEIQQRVDAALKTALAPAVEQAVALRTKDLMSQLEQERSKLMVADANFDMWEKRDRVKYAQARYQMASERGDNQ